MTRAVSYEMKVGGWSGKSLPRSIKAAYAGGSPTLVLFLHIAKQNLGNPSGRYPNVTMALGEMLAISAAVSSSLVAGEFECLAT